MAKQTILILFIAMPALLAASPAAAIDGEVLINQTKALAGNVTPGDDPGYPIGIFRSGRYKLISDLVVPASKNGFDVRHRDVTIDLNGFSVSSGGGTNKGIVSTAESVTVINGSIRGFGDAAVSLPFSYSVVENMRVLGNRVGVVVGDHGRILRNTISGNVLRPLGCGDHCLIEGNVISKNGTLAIFTEGILLKSGTVLGNTISANTGNSIAATGFVGFGNNTIVGNGGGVTGSVVALQPNACTPGC